MSRKAIRSPEETGTLEAGKLADVIIVNGDPLKDIAAMKEEENISLVMRRGAVEKSP